jgi:hypothetical protein
MMCTQYYQQGYKHTYCHTRCICTVLANFRYTGERSSDKQVRELILFLFSKSCLLCGDPASSSTSKKK